MMTRANRSDILDPEEQYKDARGKLLVLLGADAGVGVGNPGDRIVFTPSYNFISSGVDFDFQPRFQLRLPDGQLVGALHESLPVLGGDTASDLGAEGLVGHHQHLELLHVVHQHLEKKRLYSRVKVNRLRLCILIKLVQWSTIKLLP